LFERKPRGVRLTDAGRVLLPHAERVLQDIQKALRALADLQSATGGTLTVGSALTISTYTLPQVLSEFKRAYPPIEIAVRTGRSHQIQQLVLDDMVQIGLVHSPIATHPDIGSVILFDEPIVLVVPPGHPLSGRSEVSAEELATEPFITSDRASGYWVLVEQFWSSAGRVPKITMELDSIEATKRMIMGGLGLGMLPLRTVEAEIKTRQVMVVPVKDGDHLHRQTLLIYRKGKAWSGISRGFMEVVGQIYNQTLLPGE